MGKRWRCEAEPPRQHPRAALACLHLPSQAPAPVLLLALACLFQLARPSTSPSSSTRKKKPCCLTCTALPVASAAAVAASSSATSSAVNSYTHSPCRARMPAAVQAEGWVMGSPSTWPRLRSRGRKGGAAAVGWVPPFAGTGPKAPVEAPPAGRRPWGARQQRPRVAPDVSCAVPAHPSTAVSVSVDMVMPRRFTCGAQGGAGREPQTYERSRKAGNNAMSMQLVLPAPCLLFARCQLAAAKCQPFCQNTITRIEASPRVNCCITGPHKSEVRVGVLLDVLPAPPNFDRILTALL